MSALPPKAESHAARDGCAAIEFAEATYLVASIS